MNKTQRKEAKFLEDVKNDVQLERISDVKDFYLRKKNVPYRIPDVVAFRIKGTNLTLVLGSLEVAGGGRRQAQAPAATASAEVKETKEAENTVKPEVKEESTKKESEVTYTEDDILIVMKQGEVSREEAVEMLNQSGGDPLEALMALGK